jgi:hypothetical protein
MNLESRMVTEREVRHFVESRTLAARLTGILNFITMLLCLLMDMFNMPSEIRIHLNQGHGKFPSGSRAILPRPDSFALRR